MLFYLSVSDTIIRIELKFLVDIQNITLNYIYIKIFFKRIKINTQLFIYLLFMVNIIESLKI